VAIGESAGVAEASVPSGTVHPVIRLSVNIIDTIKKILVFISISPFLYS
jgi:hypothetical protein